MQAGRRTALIVNRPGVAEEPLKKALEADGWRVETCCGPAAADCPMLHARPCSSREAVDVAVVHVEGARLPQSAVLPRLRCAADSASPALAVIEGSLSAPRFAARTATVGACNAPDTIIRTVEVLAWETSA